MLAVNSKLELFWSFRPGVRPTSRNRFQLGLIFTLTPVEPCNCVRFNPRLWSWPKCSVARDPAMTARGVTRWSGPAALQRTECYAAGDISGGVGEIAKLNLLLQNDRKHEVYPAGPIRASEAFDHRLRRHTRTAVGLVPQNDFLTRGTVVYFACKLTDIVLREHDRSESGQLRRRSGRD